MLQSASHVLQRWPLVLLSISDVLHCGPLVLQSISHELHCGPLVLHSASHVLYSVPTNQPLMCYTLAPLCCLLFGTSSICQLSLVFLSVHHVVLPLFKNALNIPLYSFCFILAFLHVRLWTLIILQLQKRSANYCTAPLSANTPAALL